MYVRECISEIAAGLVCGKSGCAGVRMWTGFGNRLFAPDACIIHSKKNNCKLNQSKNSTNKQFLERESVINVQTMNGPVFLSGRNGVRRRKRPQTRHRGEGGGEKGPCADAFEEKTGLRRRKRPLPRLTCQTLLVKKIHAEKYLLSIKKAYNCVCWRLWLEMFMREMKHIHLCWRGQSFFSSFTGEEF